ncbi:hypothetical protein HBH69_133750 [Parastagonospora nodorum]|nr:hypothetical protein HBH69_133750 [Parastagonospora nodorum]
MNKEYRPDASFKPWGPFVSPNWKDMHITNADIIVASVVWVLTLINVGIAVWLASAQARVSRAPLRSVYVWMIWLELFASFMMGLESFLHLLKLIQPSFAFYFTILFWWCIQVQLLLQIIINRIRVIVPDRQRSRRIMIGTAVFVTFINVSVFFIWLPARLQVSRKYHIINEYWDRIEKGLYLIVDAGLNWYFLKTVKANLISNGLTKYNKLVRFNQRIVMVSLLMDVMIIGAMSIPNSFVYIQFHPLAYLVKLNIEMTMANLIKRIAVSASRRTGAQSLAGEFKSSSNISSTAKKSSAATQRQSAHELASIVSYHADGVADSNRIQSFTPTGRQIKTTQEVTVTNEPNTWPKTEGTGAYTMGVPHIVVQETGTSRTKSIDSSIKSEGVVKRTPEDSDDEAALVGKGRRWGRGGQK